MSDTMTERRVSKQSFDLQAEIAHLKSICGEDDPELLADMIEGETNLDQFIGKTLELIGEDAAAQKALGDYQRTIGDRKKRLSDREDRLRVLLATVVTQLPDRKYRHALASITVSDIDPKPKIDDESAIPTEFWKRADPQLDLTTIRQRLLARQDALNALQDSRTEITEDERQARLEEINSEHPEIPGASLDNGDISISIRRA